jgi:hypothetical protein
VTDLTWVRMQLAAWGWRSRAVGIGYPSMSATEKARIGRGGRGDISLPGDLEAIDHAVSTAPLDHKRILVEAYTKQCTAHEHAAHLEIPLRTFWRRRTRAEVYVGQTLASGGTVGLHSQPR